MLSENYGTAIQVTVVDFDGNPVDLGGGSAAASATEATLAIASASLQSLDNDNATEAQQTAIKNAVEAMQAAVLADNASQTKQQELINKNELLRLLLVDVLAKNEQLRSLLEDIKTNQPLNTAEITKILDALGYSSTTQLSTAIEAIDTTLKLLLAKQASNNATQSSDYSNSKLVGIASSELLGADPKRDFVEIENISDDAVYWINIGGTTATASTPGNKRLYPGDTFVSDRKSFVIKAIQIISDKANSPVTVGVSSQP